MGSHIIVGDPILGLLMEGILDGISDILCGMFYALISPPFFCTITVFLLVKYIKRKVSNHLASAELKRQIKEIFLNEPNLEAVWGGLINCRVCSETINGIPLTICRSCHTPHHSDCWEYNRICAIYGCGSCLGFSVDKKSEVENAEPIPENSAGRVSSLHKS